MRSGKQTKKAIFGCFYAEIKGFLLKNRMESFSEMKSGHFSFLTFYSFYALSVF